MHISDSKEPYKKTYGAFNYRPLVLIAIGIGLGVLSIVLQRNVMIWACIICCVMIALSVRFKNKVVFLIAFATLFGMFRVATMYPAEYELNGSNHIVKGRVYTTIDNSVVLDDVLIDGVCVEGKTLLKYVKTIPEIDDIVECVARLEQTTEMTGKSYKYYMLSEDYLFVSSDLEYLNLIGHTDTLHGFFAEIHNYLADKIDELFGNQASTIKGILLGDSSEIPEDRMGNLRDSGIAHLLALSGLHISIISSFIMFITKRMNKKVSFLVLCAVLSFYCAITAFPASLLRATIMTLLMMLSGLSGRRRDILSACSLAFIVILIVNPYQLFAAGFALSFASVIGIILMYKPVRSMFSVVTEGSITKPLSVSVSATMGIMPMTAAYFHRMPYYALITNFIAIPAVSAAVVMAIIGLILGIIYTPLAVPLSAVVNYILDGVLTMSAVVSKLPFAVIVTKSISILCGGLYYARMIAMSPYYITYPKNRLRISIVLTVLTFAAFILL